MKRLSSFYQARTRSRREGVSHTGGIEGRGPISRFRIRAGKIRYGCAMWLLGLPLPIILIALFWRGCDW